MGLFLSNPQSKSINRKNDRNAVLFAFLFILGLLLGSVLLIIGINNSTQSRQVTYKKVDKQFVITSIQESYDNYVTTYYLQLSDNSIYFLHLKDFSSSRQPPDIHEDDEISLVYDANTKTKVQAAPMFPSFGSDGRITGDGYQIVQLTTGYASVSDILSGKSNSRPIRSFSADGYLAHPHDYYKNNWLSVTGGGFLIGGIILVLVSSFLLYKELREEWLAKRNNQYDNGYPIQSWRWKR